MPWGGGTGGVVGREATVWDGVSPVRRVRRRLKSVLCTFADTGWFGLTPLRTHVCVCGYPRSGTTLMLMMLEHALPAARRFGRERYAYKAALLSWRSHSVLLSKRPNDVMNIGPLRRLYRGRTARIRFVVVVRDPRDVLTSWHEDSPERPYFLVPDALLPFDQALRGLEGDDVLFVRYEQLTRDPAVVQKEIERFTGEEFERDLVDFHREPRNDFDTRPLNGVRPIDSKTVGRWRRPEHRPRLLEVLAANPWLPGRLIELGYEPDFSWIAELPSH